MAWDLSKPTDTSAKNIFPAQNRYDKTYLDTALDMEHTFPGAAATDCLHKPAASRTYYVAEALAPVAPPDGQHIFTTDTKAGYFANPAAFAGHATVVNGSATVIGAGTAWLSTVAKDDLFKINAVPGTTYKVLNVVNDGELTLSAVYGGAGAGPVDYTIWSLEYEQIDPTSYLPVSRGGTGVGAFTPYAVLCGGATGTGVLQAIASLGTAGQVLTSNGAGALPTMQTIPVTSIARGGTGQTTAQDAIDSLTSVAGAGNEDLLTKDTATGNAIFKPLALPIFNYAPVVNGLRIKTTSAHEISLASNQVFLNSVANTPSLALTADIEVSGTNGLDTGSEAPNTWYYLFFIYNPVTTTWASLISASLVPTLPSGFTYYTLVGAARNDGYSNFIPFNQVDYTSIYDDPQTCAPTINSGAFTAITYSAAIPAIGDCGIFTLEAYRLAGGTLQAWADLNNNNTPSASQINARVPVDASNNNYGYGSGMIPLLSGTLYGRVGGEVTATALVYVNGFILRKGL